MAKKKVAGLAGNITGSLSYILGPITGVIFLVLAGENKSIKFHAAQSIALFVVWVGGVIVLMLIPVIGWILLPFWWLLMFVFWLVAMVKTWQGKKFLVPVVGKRVKGMVGK